jgi:hypothetical protein
MARAAAPGAYSVWLDGCGHIGDPMVSLMKFGKKMKLPSTVEIKHQLLVRWLADQTAIEAAEASALASGPAPEAAAARKTP